ncbi:hypothetical protein DV737_g4299, partial [Chaetothyriales sp. CBS 132003]
MSADKHSPPSPPTRTLLVGLSGPSCSGKTTLARFLRTIFTIPASASTHNRSITAFILHVDDFYKTDKDIPLITLAPPLPSGRTDTRTEQNWDCAESIDIALLSRALGHVRSTGQLPADLFSKEDQNEVGPAPDVAQSLLASLGEAVRAWLVGDSAAATTFGGDSAAATDIRIYFIDAFLLYTSPSPSPTTDSHSAAQLYALSKLLDLKLWVSCSRRQMLDRRLRRRGYVTLETFWEDPPGYIEDVVWPEFLREHAWLVRELDDGSSGGETRLVVDEEAAQREGIVVAPEEEDGSVAPMRDLVSWATRAVEGRLNAR